MKQNCLNKKQKIIITMCHTNVFNVIIERLLRRKKYPKRILCVYPALKVKFLNCKNEKFKMQNIFLFND